MNEHIIHALIFLVVACVSYYAGVPRLARQMVSNPDFWAMEQNTCRQTR